jgi:hypothetical protein
MTTARPSWLNVFCGEAGRLIGQCVNKRAALPVWGIRQGPDAWTQSDARSTHTHISLSRRQPHTKHFLHRVRVGSARDHRTPQPDIGKPEPSKLFCDSGLNVESDRAPPFTRADQPPVRSFHRPPKGLSSGGRQRRAPTSPCTHGPPPLNSRTLFAMTSVRVQPRMGRFGVH